MHRRIPLMVLVLLLVAAVGLHLWSRQPVPDDPTEETAPAPQATASAPEPPVQPGATLHARRESGADVAHPQETRGEAKLPRVVEAAAILPGYPKSRVPHRVLKAWGRDETGLPKGAIGFLIVVDPSITNAKLTELAKDVLAANQDAERMSVRIYDSEEALSPELHQAHDPVIAKHTIGRIWVNPTGSRFDPRTRIQVRGEDVPLKDTVSGPAPAEKPGSRIRSSLGRWSGRSGAAGIIASLRI